MLQFLLDLLLMRLITLRGVAFDLSDMIEFTHHGQTVPVVFRPGILDLTFLIRADIAPSSADSAFHIISSGLRDHQGGMASGAGLSVFQISQFPPRLPAVNATTFFIGLFSF